MAVEQIEKRKKTPDPVRIEQLKQAINNEEYLSGAIYHIAQIVSNRLLGIQEGGAYDERKLEGRR
ncbi:MAG: hypothetical protein LBC27_02260 [Spirochaetaceae bacterium]|jgi:hypothetical protein|nr:hypothetical protein [Spirochaetaceae bacterium]